VILVKLDNTPKLVLLNAPLVKLELGLVLVLSHAHLVLLVRSLLLLAVVYVLLVEWVLICLTKEAKNACLVLLVNTPILWVKASVCPVLQEHMVAPWVCLNVLSVLQVNTLLLLV
jgi:hypothetical protein